MNSNTPVSALAFQNTQVQSLARDSYGHKELEALRALLRDNETMRLVRYSTGGASAVTPLYGKGNDPWLCLESALDGLLINMWDRDSILQAVGELIAANDPQLGEGLKIDSDAFRRGLLASLSFHYRYQHRFTDIISDRKSGLDYSARPNIRYNAVGLFELSDAWGHAQNDALGAINFFLFYCLNNGQVSWFDPALQPAAETVACLLHCFWWKIHVWEDWDLGAWEDVRAEHASSIAVVLASLREQLKFMQSHGNLSCFAANRTFDVTVDGVQQLIDKCEAKLREILPAEYIRGDGGSRSSDAALVNGLFLAALSGRALLDDDTDIKVIDRLENELGGHIGIARYKYDQWDGRNNRPGVPEAQWTHVSPMLSFIFGEKYRRTGNDSYRQRQLFHFNRAIACVNPRFHMPEAYIAWADGKGGWNWDSDANESLAWSQAMLLCSFAGMKASVDYQAKLVATTATPVAALS